MKASMFMLLLLCICAAILISLSIYSQFRIATDQGDAYQKLEQKADELEGRVNALLEEQVRLSAELRSTEAAAQAARDAAAEAATDPKNTPAYRQSFFAKAFLDDEYVGLAKVTPVFRTDDKTGETIFENIINLSGDARKSLTKTVTNVVEREVVRNTTLNNNYTSEQPYWYAYPGWIRPARTNHPPGMPNPMPPIVNPNSPNTGSSQWKNSDGTAMWQNGKPWVPKTLK
jgi:outer membrane murein-binding lipoprotein Lpp